MKEPKAPGDSGKPRKPENARHYPVKKPESAITRRSAAAQHIPRQTPLPPGALTPPDIPAPDPDQTQRGQHPTVPGKSPEYRIEPDPALADTQDMDPAEIEVPEPADPAAARISFGQAAVALKLVTPAQIQECVNVQRALLQKGQRVPLLGQLLLDRGHLDRAGIDRIKAHQQLFQIAERVPGYKLVEKLGQGAMGTVYKARQLRMERWVAIKVLQPELAANPVIKGRFLHEARASARLNHPNVITGIDAGEINGLCYFAMEYVDGRTIQQLVKERGPMDERLALELFIQVARALEHAEKHSLVHRDVKPDNIMVTRERVVKLLDLGLAKVRAAEDQGAARGMAIGTPNYISPEQAMGKPDIDTRADIYSLGVTLFFALTGRVPYDGPPEVVMYRHIHEPCPHPRNLRPDIGEGTATLIFHMMAKRPQDRPASAAQLVTDMDHLVRTGKLPVAPPVAPPPVRVAKPSHPQPQSTPDAPRLPRKRKHRFDAGW